GVRPVVLSSLVVLAATGAVIRVVHAWLGPDGVLAGPLVMTGFVFLLLPRLPAFAQFRADPADAASRWTSWPGRLRRSWHLPLAFLLPFGAYLLTMAVRGVYPFGPDTLLISDMSHQYAQFYSYLHQAALGGGSLLYTWRADLGLNAVPLAAYYLCSPF